SRPAARRTSSSTTATSPWSTSACRRPTASTSSSTPTRARWAQSPAAHPTRSASCSGGRTRPITSRARSDSLVALALPVQRRGVDAEDGRRLVEGGGPRQHPRDVLALDGVEREVAAEHRQLDLRLRDAVRERGRLDDARRPEDHGALDGVAELAHVARPGVGGERLLRRLRERQVVAAGGLGEEGEEAVGQRQDVLPALAQRRQAQRGDAEPGGHGPAGTAGPAPPPE